MKRYGYLVNSYLLIGFVFLMGCSSNSSVATVDTHRDIEQSINQRLPTKCGFQSLYYGKVRYDKISKTYYLTVEDGDYGGTFELDQFASHEVTDKYVILYGSQLVGGDNRAIEGKILQVVYDKHQIDFDKLKAWCALQPNSSEEPKAPSFKRFKYKK